MDIIIIVIILVICCCCIILGGGGYYFLQQNGDNTQSAPVSSNAQSAPASGSNTSAPASGSNASAPASGSNASAPVSSIKTSEPNTPAPTTTTPGPTTPKKPGPKIVCGVNSSDTIKCANNKDITTNPDWKDLPGSGSNVSVNSDGSLYLTNSGEGIWYKPDIKLTSNWRNLSGGLKQISGNNGFFCGVNSGKGIWCKPDATSAENWKNLSGSLINVSVNDDGSIFGVNDGGEVLYKSNYADGGGWKTLSKGALSNGLKQISNKDGVICGVDSSNAVFCADQDITSSPNWKKLPGSLNWISVNGDGSLFGTNFGGQVLYKSNYNDNNAWTVLPGGLKQISSI
jgi:hypothetical protein